MKPNFFGNKKIFPQSEKESGKTENTFFLSPRQGSLAFTKTCCLRITEQ